MLTKVAGFVKSSLVLYTFSILVVFSSPFAFSDEAATSAPTEKSAKSSADLLQEALSRVQDPSTVDEMSIALVPKYITQRNEPEQSHINQFWGVCSTQEKDLIKKAAKLLSNSKLRTRRPSVYRPLFQQIIKFDTKDNHSYEFYISKEYEEDNEIKGIVRLDGVSSISITGNDIIKSIYELAGAISAKSSCTSYPKGENVN